MQCNAHSVCMRLSFRQAAYQPATKDFPKDVYDRVVAGVKSDENLAGKTDKEVCEIPLRGEIVKGGVSTRVSGVCVSKHTDCSRFIMHAMSNGFV